MWKKKLVVGKKKKRDNGGLKPPQLRALNFDQKEYGARDVVGDDE
jgi:hypothetical protein